MNIKLTGTTGNDSLIGAEGNDTLNGDAGNDFIVGAQGGDSLNGGAGNDTLDGGAGNDILAGSSGVDLLLGGEGDDTLYASSNGDNTLIGGAGNDTYSLDTVYEGRQGLIELGKDFGVDTVRGLFSPPNGSGEYQSYQLVFSSAEYSSDKARLVLVNNGSPETVGGESVWALTFDGLSDQVLFPLLQYRGVPYGNFKLNYIFAKPGQFGGIIGALDSPESIVFGDGVVWTKEDMREKSIHPDQPGRMVYGTEEAEVLESKPDRIQILDAAGGNDTLVASAYNNLLIGGAGADTYVLKAGWGALHEGVLSTGVYQYRDAYIPAPGYVFYSDVIDVPYGSVVAGVSNLYIKDSASDASEQSIIQFVDGSTLADLRFEILADGKLIIGRVDSEQRLDVYLGQVDAATGQVVNPNVRYIELADGTQLTAEDIYRISRSQMLTEFADNVEGTEGYDSFMLLGGDDRATGLAGNDVLDGGTGNDVLFGNDGADILIGGDGNDSLSGGEGRSTMYGGAGNDTVMGGSDVDVMSGGAGNDGLGGLGGNDSINGDEGDDTISAYGDSNNPHSMVVGGVGDDNISARYASLVDGGAGHDSIGASYTARVMAGDGNDTVRAGLSPLVDGQAGDDFIVVPTGDTVLGGAGNDTMQGGYTSNDPLAAKLIDGGEGDDVIDFISGHVLGGAGNDTIHMHGSMVEGGAGDDVFFAKVKSIYSTAAPYPAGATKQTLNGDDLYVFRPGFGQDTISEEGFEPIFLEPHLEEGTSIDTIELVGGISPADVSFSWYEEPVQWYSGVMRLTLNATGDTITFTPNRSRVHPYNTAGEPLNLSDGIEKIRFADSGLEWSAEQFSAFADAADPGGLRIGTDADNLLQGGSGNETLMGWLGNDRYVGGTGDDRMIDYGSKLPNYSGGATRYTPGGSDTYVFGLGDGDDFIEDQGGTSALAATDMDVVEFGAGITPENLTLRALASQAAGSSGSVASDSDYTLLIGTRLSGDSLTIYRQGAAERQIELFKFADGTQWTAADLAARLSQLIEGTDGSDTLNAVWGLDTLLGGAGDDVLYGYQGPSGSSNPSHGVLVGGLGNDTLLTGSGADTIRFAAGDGADVLTADGQDTIELGAGIARSSLAIGRLGASGANRVVLGLGGTDSITLTDAGQWGGLMLKFADGSVLTGAQIYAEATKPIDLKLSGTAGKDTLTGKDGNDTLSGLAGNDRLSGLAGNDLLDGGTGNDTLTGGLGNDRSIGGKGNDTYLFARGDGQDTVVDQDSTWFNSDLLKISGATSRQLWLTKAGSNLDISIIGSTDKVSIEGWFASSNNRVEKITAGDGKTLYASRVNALVNAMAGFAPPAQGQTTLPAHVQTALSKVLASSWV